jgi:hypothetical protein
VTFAATADDMTMRRKKLGGSAETHARMAGVSLRHYNRVMAGMAADGEAAGKMHAALAMAEEKVHYAAEPATVSKAATAAVDEAGHLALQVTEEAYARELARYGITATPGGTASLRPVLESVRAQAGLPPAPPSVDELRKAAGAQPWGSRQGSQPAAPNPENLDAVLAPIQKAEREMGRLDSREAAIALLLASQPHLEGFVEEAERARWVQTLQKAIATGQPPPPVQTVSSASTELTPPLRTPGDLQSRLAAAVDWARRNARWDLLAGPDQDLVAAWMAATSSGTKVAIGYSGPGMPARPGRA